MLFLILTTLVQNFNIKMPEGHSKPKQKEKSTGIIANYKDFWVNLEARA